MHGCHGLHILSGELKPLGIVFCSGNVPGSRNSFHDDGLRVFAEPIYMRYRYAVLTKNLKDVGFAAKFRKRVNIAATLASNVQFELRLSCRSEEHTSELQSRPHLVCR